VLKVEVETCTIFISFCFLVLASTAHDTAWLSERALR